MFSINGNAAESTGFSDVSSGITSFFAPLKKGPKYINEAVSQVPLNNASRVFAEDQAKLSHSDFESKLKNIMINNFQGKVTAYKETDSIEKLNGNYVIKTYSVTFYGGQTKTMEFKFIKPVTNGNYQFVDASILD